MPMSCIRVLINLPVVRTTVYLKRFTVGTLDMLKKLFPYFLKAKGFKHSHLDLAKCKSAI